MMRVLSDSDNFAVVVGVDLMRWYIGLAIEFPQEDVRMGVFRLGPFYVHIINRL